MPINNVLFRTLICVGVLFKSFTTAAEYILNEHQQNLSCVNWEKAPEAVVGNCTRHVRALHCYGGMNNLPSISVHKLRNLEEIILCGWPDSTFDPPAVLQHFPKLRALTIEYSNLTEIVNDFPESFYLQSVNISWTKLSHINTMVFRPIHTLKFLDLRWNNFSYLEKPLTVSRYFGQMLLGGNPWNCTQNLRWLLESEQGATVADRDQLICGDYKYKERNLMTIINYKAILEKECETHRELQNCTCNIHYVTHSGDGKSLIPIYSVNCSGLQLYNFPSYLPDNTTIFHANDNRISDVRALRNNKHYRKVIDIYLDNNYIENIDVLDAGYWLWNFRVLSLRGNRLKKLPIYALENALQDNDNALKLQLSSNPWVCTCKFAMKFRDFLMKYHTVIFDSRNITCNYTRDNRQIQAAVLSIDRSDVCKLPEEAKIFTLDMLNGVLATLIVFVLGKLAYDYYHYKNYGRLPWIVTKLP